MKKSFVKPQIQKIAFLSEDVITWNSWWESSYISSGSGAEYETEDPDF